VARIDTDVQVEGGQTAENDEETEGQM